jgi:hypothetical protein
VKSYRIPLFGGCHNLVRTHSRKCRAPGRLSVISIEQTDRQADPGNRGEKPGIGKARKPETGQTCPSPTSSLALVLNIVVANLQSVFSEGKENLVPDRHARLSVPATELLHHVFRHLG